MNGHDYVLIGRRAALKLPFGEMMRELDAALRSHSRPRSRRQLVPPANGPYMRQVRQPLRGVADDRAESRQCTSTE